jgi:hypothetical protein
MGSSDTAATGKLVADSSKDKARPARRTRVSRSTPAAAPSGAHAAIFDEDLSKYTDDRGTSDGQMLPAARPEN